jgi:hypothetical protein
MMQAVRFVTNRGRVRSNKLLPAPPPAVKNAHVIISLTKLAIICGENVYVRSFATKVGGESVFTLIIYWVI